MTPELYRRVSELIGQMLETGPARWPDLLARAESEYPGSAEAAKQMLAHIHTAETYLESPVIIYPGPFHDDPADPFNILGTTLDGTWMIEELIGSGGMGAVYRARHVMLPRDAAIKMVRRELADFVLVEGAAGVEINHPNIVPVTDLRRLPSADLYLVMEFIKGASLRQWLNRKPAPSPATACGILSQVASALDAAHARGYVHRDIKPENILIAADGEPGSRVRVIDFGIALDVRTVDLETFAGVSPGTPRYMSPEQWLGGAVGPQSDIYSLGLVAFEMLAGSPAFVTGGNRTIREQVTEGALIPLHAAAPGLPDRVCESVSRALALSAADRYETAGAFATDLAASLEPQAARRPAPHRRPEVRVVAPSLRPLERIDLETSTGTTSVELYQGDLLAIPRDWRVDVLAVSRLPEEFTAAPGTVSADIKRKGIDASRIIKDEDGSVRLGESEVVLRSKRHEGKPVYTPPIQGVQLGDAEDPRLQVENMFGALGELLGPISNGVVAMPLSELVPGGQPAMFVAGPVLEATLEHLRRGANISRLIIVENDPTMAAAAREALQRLTHGIQSGG